MGKYRTASAQKNRYRKKKKNKVMSTDEYIKVRVQSSPEEINGFHMFLDKCEELGLCQVMNFSDMFPNQGTRRYFRAYSDVKLSKEDVDNE